MKRGIDMIENGFYKIKQEYIELIRDAGGVFKDAKERHISLLVN